MVSTDLLLLRCCQQLLLVPWMVFPSVYFAVIYADELFSLWEREGEEYLHLLSYFSLPIINENQTNGHAEIKYILQFNIFFGLKILKPVYNN